MLLKKRLRETSVGLLVAWVMLWFCLVLSVVPSLAQPSEVKQDNALASTASDTLIRRPSRPADTMSVDEVRIGMKGYGLTVFAGTKIEPFPVEVVTIVKSQTPGHSVIWIESDDPRLLNSGPVQGMSGSPIYLWEQGEKGQPGEGGRLIGAFAFGFGATLNTCLAGVQPIKYMLDASGRTNEDDAKSASTARNHNNPAVAQTMLDQVDALAAQRGLSDAQLNLSRTVRRMLAQSEDVDAPTQPARAERSQPFGGVSMQNPAPLMLPLAVPSSELVDVLSPMFKPYGVQPLAGGPQTAIRAGSPPLGIDPDTTVIQPGSVLSVPLAYGDVDFSGSGTVTYVTPEGKVLAFGHAMFGTGDASMPLANGYVQFLVPSRQISFKRAGSMRILGTLRRDENTAVVGMPGQTFTTAPVTVDVDIEGLPAESYQYEIVHHPMLTPQLAAAVSMVSLVATQQMPPKNTVELQVTMQFEGGREVDTQTAISPADPGAIAAQMVPVIAFMQHNPYEQVQLESMQVRVRVKHELEAAVLMRAWLPRMQVEPGDAARVQVQIQPMQAPPITKTLELKIPETAAEGDYPILVGGAEAYLMTLMQSQPQLFNVNSVDEAVDTLNRIGRLGDRALYATLVMPNQGLAIGRSKMEQLPGSREVVLRSQNSEDILPIAQTIEASLPLDDVLQGQAHLMLHVRKPYRGVDVAK